MNTLRLAFTYFGIVLGLNACDKSDEVLGKKRSEHPISAEIENLSIDSKVIKPTPTPTSTSTTPPPPDYTLPRAAAFKTVLYPLLKERCSGSGCHDRVVAPLFAQADSLQAWVAAAGKIDFLDVKNSQLVVRVNNNHNCWSDCAADATTIATEIERLRDTFAHQNILAQKNLTQSNKVAFNKAEAGESEPNEASVVNLITQSTEKSADLVEKSEKIHFDGDTKTATYMEWPKNSPTTKIAFSMTVPDEDSYYLIVRAKPLDNNSRINSLTSTLNGVELSKNASPTGNRARDWQWYVLNLGRSDKSKLSGKVKVALSDSDGGFVFNRIALVKDYKNITNDEATRKVKILRVPINEICEGKDVTLRFEVSDIPDDLTKKGMTIRNLRAETSERIHIKGVEVMINGKYSPTNTTFRLVSEAVAPPGMLLSRAALLAVGEGGIASDQISFAVERCD